MKKLRKTLLTVAVCLSLCNINTAEAKDISFDYILSKTLENSYDLKMADINIKISKQNVKEAKLEYLPTLNTYTNAEYSMDVDQDNPFTFATVGDKVLNSNTRYQDLIALNLSYNLFDFGIRGKKVKIAKKDVNSKELQYKVNLRDTATQVADLYANTLICYKEIAASKKVMPIYKKVFSLKNRLYQNGLVSKIEMTDNAIKLARTVDKIDSLQIKLKNFLSDLAFYTGESYDPKETKLLGFAKVNLPEDFNYENMPDSQIYNLEIDKKEKELSILKRENLPMFGIYSKYNLYGSNKSSPIKSISDLSDRSLAFGVTAILTPTNVFKNFNNQKKLKLEIEKLSLQKAKRMTEIQTEYHKLSTNAKAFERVHRNKLNLLKHVEAKLNMMKELKNNDLLNQCTLLDQEAEVIMQEFDTEKSNIHKTTNAKKMQIMTGQYFSENL